MLVTTASFHLTDLSEDLGLDVCNVLSSILLLLLLLLEPRQNSLIDSENQKKVMTGGIQMEETKRLFFKTIKSRWRSSRCGSVINESD